MRPILPFSLATILALACLAETAVAQDVLYRCETATGISIQGVRCPKGATQRTIPVERPSAPEPVVPAAAPAANVSKDADTPPVTPPSAMRGPYDPYPLWQCMRADGSTFDSRDGIPGKQWVVAETPPADAADGETAKPQPVQIVAKPKLHEHVVRPYNDAQVADDVASDDAGAPPEGAAPGHWIADSCVQLTPKQACERFAARRDALRKQIYAHNPSERATWAPEEQDLTSMLYANCGL